jgi:hypothetical protein
VSSLAWMMSVGERVAWFRGTTGTGLCQLYRQSGDRRRAAPTLRAADVSHSSERKLSNASINGTAPIPSATACNTQHTLHALSPCAPGMTLNGLSRGTMPPSLYLFCGIVSLWLAWKARDQGTNVERRDLRLLNGPMRTSARG